MSSRILLVEDEPGLVLTLTDLLRMEGHELEIATDGDSGLERAVKEQFDLLVLDVMLPKLSGFELCRTLRDRGSDLAILMLTARSQVVDRVAGLKLGADDYLVKPFDPDELVARVDALLRRVPKKRSASLAQFHFGEVDADFEKGEVFRRGTRVSLAGKELELLRYLIENRDRIVSRDELLKNVWEYQPAIVSRTVDVHVAWLRQKLEEHPQFPRHLQTVRGVGYRFST